MSNGSFGGFIGYGFNQYVAIEAGYRQLGKYDVDFYGGASVDLKAKQTHVSVLGFYPLNPQLDIYGRLGWNKLREVIFAAPDANTKNSPALILVRGTFDMGKINGFLKGSGVAATETLSGTDFYTKAGSKEDMGFSFLDS